MNTPRHTATVMATLLVGTLTLSACGEQAAPDDAGAEQVVSEADLAEDARRADRLVSQLSLQELRKIHPTAGLEVPPAALRRSTYAEKLTENNLHTGIPRAEAADRAATNPRRADGADIGWPGGG